MRILFHLGHPAHYHLFKNTISALKEDKHEVNILIKKKDVLETLLASSSFEYENILPEGRKDSSLSMILGLFKQTIRMILYCLKNRPTVLIGTSTAIAYTGFILRIPSINVTEDDFDVVPIFSKITYPFATDILTPNVCRMGKWRKKTFFHKSYHELAYLHPNHFIPNENIVSKYISEDQKYFILRFAKLTAHHDFGISGINNEIALKIIDILSPHGKVYITSERELSAELEPYRLQIEPKDIHHLIYSSSMFVGDSQTMAAESAVLGVPSVRFNDFVGKISYLNELERTYNLGYGIRTNEVNKLYSTIEKLIKNENLHKDFQTKREHMLSEKIDYSKFLTWFIGNYPKSREVLRDNLNYQDIFI